MAAARRRNASIEKRRARQPSVGDQPLAQIRLDQESLDVAGQFCGVAGSEDQAGGRVIGAVYAKQPGQGPVGAGDHRRAGSHRLDERRAEALVLAGLQVDVGQAVVGGYVGNAAGEGDAPRHAAFSGAPPQGGGKLLRHDAVLGVAHDEQMQVGIGRGEQAQGVDEQVYALVAGDATDVEQHAPAFQPPLFAQRGQLRRVRLDGVACDVDA